MRRALLVIAAVGTISAFVICGSAGAEIITVGAPLDGSVAFASKTCESAGCGFFNGYGRAPAPGVTPIFPNSVAKGVIVRLNVAGATAPGTMRVRTARYLAPFERFFEAASAPIGIVPSAGVQSYPLAMPVEFGDEFVLSMSAGSSIGFGEANASFGLWSSDPPESGASMWTRQERGVVAFNVEIQPIPAINSVTPRQGSTEGGTTVSIGGYNFIGVTGVAFDGVPATSYTVESENALVATAPPHVAGRVSVTVTTIAGTSTFSPFFVYKTPPPTPHCVVPRLRGRSLGAARRALRAADCRLGTVTRLAGATAKNGRVARQGAKRGTTLVAGAKVAVTLRPPGKR